MLLMYERKLALAELEQGVRLLLSGLSDGTEKKPTLIGIHAEPDAHLPQKESEPHDGWC
jgi:hypothetical protein